MSVISTNGKMGKKLENGEMGKKSKMIFIKKNLIAISF